MNKKRLFKRRKLILSLSLSILVLEIVRRCMSDTTAMDTYDFLIGNEPKIDITATLLIDKESEDPGYKRDDGDVNKSDVNKHTERVSQISAITEVKNTATREKDVAVPLSSTYLTEVNRGKNTYNVGQQLKHEEHNELPNVLMIGAQKAGTSAVSISIS